MFTTIQLLACIALCCEVVCGVTVGYRLSVESAGAGIGVGVGENGAARGK